ncbi:MAG: M28 family peptidase [Oceanicaulis sp.]
MRMTFAAASVLVLAACTSLPSAPQAGAPSMAEATEPAQSVRAGAIEAHIRFLADDLMEGREAGERGYDLAANYVEAQYRLIGLEPGGLDGYRAAVPLQTVTALPEAARFEIDGEALTPGADFIVEASAHHDESEVTAEAVFAGFGIVAPQLGVNDYEGLDVAGKIVVILAGVPENAPSDVAAHLNNSGTRAAFAAAAGAAGIVTIPAEGLTRYTYSRRAARARQPSMTVAADAAAASLQVEAYLSEAAATRLFEGAPENFESVIAAARAGEAVPAFALGKTVTLAQATTREIISDDNVVGVLPGSDPGLAGEPVIVTAHLDHVGICRLEEAEDRICNGALDNASGTSIMIETARALSGGAALRRPIVFVALAAEEKGLLGAAHIAANPTPAMAGMVANINLDMPVIRYRFEDLIAFGAEHSTLGPLAEAAAGRRGVALTPDPLPEQALFTRSDHYHFVRAGVPSLFLMTGFSSPDAEDDEGQGFLRFLGGDYHGPGDEVDQVLFEQGAKFAEINMEIIREVANADATPAWNEDSFFKSLAE